MDSSRKTWLLPRKTKTFSRLTSDLTYHITLPWVSSLLIYSEDFSLHNYTSQFLKIYLSIICLTLEMLASTFIGWAVSVCLTIHPFIKGHFDCFQLRGYYKRNKATVKICIKGFVDIGFYLSEINTPGRQWLCYSIVSATVDEISSSEPSPAFGMAIVFILAVLIGV